MNSVRRLTLHRERLAELTAKDLRQVAGAVSGMTCPMENCVGVSSDNFRQCPPTFVLEDCATVSSDNFRQCPDTFDTCLCF